MLGLDPIVATGMKVFTDFFGQFERCPVKSTIVNFVAIVAEKDMVVLAFRRELKDPKKEGRIDTTTWFDMFCIEKGKIAEHWDYSTKCR